MPQELTRLSKLGQAYVLGVSIVGLVVAGNSLAELLVHQIDRQWLILAALTIFTGAFTVRIPGIPAHLSVSDTFVLVTVFLFGPAAGTIIALLDALIISLRVGQHAREPFRVVFNVAAVALSSNAAGQVFFGVAGIQPYSIQPTPLSHILFPLFLCSLTYFLLNSWLVTFALAIEKGRRPFAIWRDNFLWLSVNYFVGGSVAGLLVTYSREIDLTTLGIIVPLLLISYLTFKTSLGRIEDANQHLTRVNKMYLSTIETLAMAIDAKDQITHGHIRRVQRLAVGLAKVVGVNDEVQIRAIEAAALLHDMGKIAIPEFILNKPGKLTGNEFEIMKQHAHIGADILSSIQFPYPVVPIVRHHHESWDGSGYPTGLKGVAIPIGARILSVVDCFDALTSDRPYRPRLSTKEAVEILIQRRGTMYDPLIVDRFIEAQQQLSESAESREGESEAVQDIATKLRVSPEPEVPQLDLQDDRLPLKALSLLRTINPSPAGISIEDVGLLISSRLAKLANFSAAALYIGTESHHSIKCAYSNGPLSSLANGPEIQFGEQLSGWVAAHRTPIWNSDATLDLSTDIARAAGVTLGSSVPLIDNDVFVGTVTLYSPAGQEIGAEQRMLIQALAPSLARALASSIAHNQTAAIDGVSPRDREVLYSVMDALLSSRAKWPDRTHPDRLAIVRVSWYVNSSIAREQYESMRGTLERAVAAATNNTGHVIRLGPSDLLVVAARKHLDAVGLEPQSSPRSGRQTDIEVIEIANSLQLREALGLIVASDAQATIGKPLIH